MGQAQMCMGFEGSQLGPAGPCLVWTLSILGVSFNITAIMTNEMVRRYDTAGGEQTSFCGFRDEWEISGQFFRAIKYSYFCDNPTEIPARFENLGLLSTDYCETQACGRAWIVLAIAAAMLGIATILFTLKGCVSYEDMYDQGGFSVCKKFLELFACILAIGAIMGWFFNNDVCWNELERDNDLVEVGQSIWWMSGATGCYMLACIFRFI